MADAAAHKTRAKKAVLFILVALLAQFLFTVRQDLNIHQWAYDFNAWVGSLGPVGMLVYVCAYVLAAVLLLPGSLLTIGAGFLFGLFWGTAVASVGATAGAAAGFLVARYLARNRIQARADRHPRFRAIDRAVAAEGWKIVGLLRLSPVIPYNLSNYLYGLTGVGFWPYLIASWIGMIPATVMYVYLGAAGKAGLEAAGTVGRASTPMEVALFWVGLLATVGVTLYVTRIARRALKESALAEAERNDE